MTQDMHERNGRCYDAIESQFRRLCGSPRMEGAIGFDRAARDMQRAPFFYPTLTTARVLSGRFSTLVNLLQCCVQYTVSSAWMQVGPGFSAGQELRTGLYGIR